MNDIVKEIDSNITKLIYHANFDLNIGYENNSFIRYPQYLDKYLLFKMKEDSLVITLDTKAMQKDNFKFKKSDKIHLSLPKISSVFNQHGFIDIYKTVENGPVFEKSGEGGLMLQELKSEKLIKEGSGLLWVEKCGVEQIEDLHGNIKIDEINSHSLQIKSQAMYDFEINSGKIINLKINSFSNQNMTINAHVENLHATLRGNGDMSVSVQSSLLLENNCAGNVKIKGPIVEKAFIEHDAIGHLSLEKIDTAFLQMTNKGPHCVKISGSANIMDLTNFGTTPIDGGKLKVQHSYMELYSSGSVTLEPQKTIHILNHSTATVNLLGKSILDKSYIENSKAGKIMTKKVKTHQLEFLGEGTCQLVNENKTSLKVK